MGGVLGNCGETTVHAKTQEGTARTITWQNLKLDLPITSTREMTADGSFLLMGHDLGYHLDPVKGSCDQFVSHADVYFQNIFVPKSLVGDKPVFTRPGVA